MDRFQIEIPGWLPRGRFFLLNAFTPNDQFAPAIAMADNGRANNGEFVISWTEAGGVAKVMARHYTSSGIPGAEFHVNDVSNHQYEADVIANREGGFVVTWADDDYTDGSRSDISLQRVDSSDCTARPDPNCGAAGKGALLVQPAKILAKLLKGPALTQAELGNPLNPGGTACMQFTSCPRLDCLTP